MLKINIDGEKYTLPTSYEEMKVKHLVAANINDKSDRLTIIANLIGYNPEKIKDILSLSDLEKLTKATKFLDEKPKVRKNRPIIINGQQYKHFEKIEQVTLGEWTDIEGAIKIAGDNSGQAISKVISIILRPYNNGKIEKYNSKKNKEREELFLENLSALDAMQITAFFLHRGHYFMLNIRKFLKVQKKKKVKQKSIGAG